MPARCRFSRLLRRALSSPRCGKHPAGRAPDRPALHRQHERAPRGLDPAHRGGRAAGLVARHAPLWPGARPDHPAIQGGAQHALLREQPFRAGAGLALPFAVDAGGLGAPALDPAACGVRGERLLVRRRRRGRFLRPPVRYAAGSSKRPVRRWTRFEQVDPIEAYADMLAFAAGFGPAHQERRPAGAWRPTRINLGSGKDYKPGWLNLDILDRAEPDAVLDLGGSDRAAHDVSRAAMPARCCWRPPRWNASTPTTCSSTCRTCRD